MLRLLRVAPLPLLAVALATGPAPAATATTCDQPAVIEGVTYCTVDVADVARGTQPGGTAVILREVSADEVYYRTVYVYVPWDCPPDMFCGTGMEVAEIAFPGGPVPQQGAVMDVWGRTLDGGGMDANGFAAG